MARRTSTAIAGIALGLASLAGCGVEGGAGGPQQVASSSGGSGLLARSAQTTQVAGTFRFEVTNDVGTSSMPLAMRTEGAVDEASGRSRVSTVVDVGELDLPDALPSDDLGSEVIFDGDALYVRMPLLTTFVGFETPWARVELGGQLEGLAEGAVPVRPDSILDLLADLDGEVEEVGREDVRGIGTDHLRAELDIDDLLARAEGERRGRLEDRLREQGVDPANLFGPTIIDVWVDDDGLLHRIVLTMSIEGVASIGRDEPSEPVEVSTTVELFDHGQPVDIELPPADEVTDLDPADLWGD